MALAAVLLATYYWSDLHDAGRTFLIVASVVACHGIGFFLRYGRKAKRLSEIAFFIGCLFFGAGIFLLGETYRLSAHYPDALWWWALGVLPLAFLLDSLILHVLLIAVIGIWAGLEVIGYPFYGAPFFFWRWSWLPNAAYWLLPVVAAGMIWCYRRRSPWGVLFYAPLLAWWIVLQPVAWHWEESTIYYVAAAGGLLLMAAEAHAPGSRMAIPHRLWGVLLFGVTTAVLSFHEVSAGIMEHSTRVGGFVAALLLSLASMFAVSVHEGMKYRFAALGRHDLTAAAKQLMQRQWLPLVWMAGIGVSALLNVPFVGGSSPQAENVAWAPAIIANAAMLAFSFWLIHVGLREERGLPFAAGVVYFLVWTICRYFEWFDRAGGILGAAVLFFLCGSVLLAATVFWFKRMKSHDDSPASKTA